MSEFIRTKMHDDIFNWIVDNPAGANLVINARAGSGKTSTMMESLNFFPRSSQILSVAFNKPIADTLTTKLKANGHDDHVQGRTYHSLGNEAIRNAFGFVKLDKDRIYNELPYYLDKFQYRYLYSDIKQLVSLVKANLSETDDETLLDLANYHNIELNGDAPIVFDTVRKLLVPKSRYNVIDFDDMPYLPVKHGLNMPKFDSIIIDELQDTSRVQIELVLKAIRGNGVIIGVGDEFQSIYGFRGADVTAIPSLIERLHAQTLPLSMTYRNPQTVVDLVNQRFPYIPFQVRDNAPMGVVDSMSSYKFLDTVSSGDMVLCRTNAPLIEYCFALIRQGKKAIVKGRDIGKGLQTLIKRAKTDNVNDLMTHLEDYREVEVERLLRANKTAQAIHAQDKIDTIIAISDGCRTVTEVLSKIDTIFSDDIEGTVFSSIHKAKGLEAKTVHIIHPELLPHPMAKQGWEKMQESNMEYVAYTRSLENLYIVS